MRLRRSGADVRRVQEAGRCIEDGFEKGEAELFEDMPRGMVVGVVPGIDFRQPQFPPAQIERALCRFEREAPAPASLHDMEAQLDIRLARRIDPRPQSAAPDKPAALPLEQRPILDAGGPLALDLGM